MLTHNKWSLPNERFPYPVFFTDEAAREYIQYGFEHFECDKEDMVKFYWSRDHHVMVMVNYSKMQGIYIYKTGFG